MDSKLNSALAAIWSHMDGLTEDEVLAVLQGEQEIARGEYVTLEELMSKKKRTKAAGKAAAKAKQEKREKKKQGAGRKSR